MYLFLLFILSFIGRTHATDIQNTCSANSGIWSNTTNSCFKHYKSFYTWPDSYAKCVSAAPAKWKGRLALIPNEDVFRAIRLLDLLITIRPSSNYYWIGLKARNQSKISRYLGNGTSFPYKHEWAFFEGDKVVAPLTWLPNTDFRSYGTDWDCMFLSRRSMFLSRGCGNSHYRICEFLPPASEVKEYCSSTNGTWSPTTNSCFKQIDKKGTWSESYQNCISEAPKGIKGRLAVISSETVSNLIRSLIVLNKNGWWRGWFGLKARNKPSQYRKGTNFPYNDQWAFFEGSIIVASFLWVPRHVYVNSYGAYCIYLRYRKKESNTELSYYDDGSCDSAYPAVCEFLQQDIDECASNPCSHGGTCTTDQPDAYTCNCAPGYSGTNCETDIDECASNPCSHGGTCTTDQPDAYTCNCAPGYSGTNCETDIDECASNPCSHGGTCTTDQPDAYTCNCAPGYSGTNCETDIDECASNPCSHGGTCTTDQPDAYTCNCAPGYSGTNCETDIDECASNPCSHGGTCTTDQPDAYTCNCAPGYSGTNCETDINECNSSPCQNGGNCRDLINRFNCTCATGYTGHRCERDVDECSSNPCRNGGSCLDGVNNYVCQCVAGFTGNTCEANVDECDSHPCSNGGTCFDGLNNYTCHCAPGFSGNVCEINVNECNSNPCENLGTCIDGINNYTCKCAPGFTGINCQININECNSNPCQNDATCRDGVNNYSCQCSTGFTGYICETNVDECSSNPCNNKGTCYDGLSNYTCQCTPGFSGNECETILSIPSHLKPIFDPAGIDEHVLANEAAVSLSVQDALPFVLDSLSQRDKIEMGHKLKEIIPRCTFNGVKCKENDFKKVYDPVLGNCFTFNYKDPSTYSTYRAGSGYGLMAIIQASQSDYIGSSQTPGFRILVHNSSEHPFPDSEGYNIAPGSSVSLSIINGCMRSCFQNILMDKCHCGDPRIPFPTGTIPCGLAQSNTTKEKCLDFYRICQDEYVDLTKCNCQSPCQESVFDAVLTTANLENVKFLEGICKNTYRTGNRTFDCLKNMKMNFALVRIFYEKLSYRVFVETEAYSFYQMASDFGGVVGIVLGISAISLVEFMYLTVHLIVYCFTSSKNNDSDIK